MNAPLREQISTLFRGDPEQPLSDPEFNRIALEVFAFQYQCNIPYRAYCDRRGATPDSVAHWQNVPAVPTAAFKEIALVAGSSAAAQRVFRTSGTTHGSERRGAHYLLDLELYHEALLPMFQAYLLPDLIDLPFISLVPHAGSAPDSSLSQMVTVVAERLASRTDWLIDAQHGIDQGALHARLEEAQIIGQAVCVLGTSFAFVHLLDAMREHAVKFSLPPGSRIMDTGGFKGRSRSVPAEQLRRDYAELLGVPEPFTVNEYGMTEMCSQFYDATLRDHLLGRPTRERSKWGAPWVRSRVVDPDTLRPVAPGEEGILQHFDLANLYSVMAIQTEDRAREAVNGFVTLGRTEGATPRGCSIAMDILLEATRA